MKIKIVLALISLTFSFMVSGQISFEPDSTFYYKVTGEDKLKMDIFKPINQ